MTLSDYVDGQGDIPAEANAKLIASAPELLRELKKCVAAIRKWGESHPESGGWMGVINNGLNVIAKVEG